MRPTRVMVVLAGAVAAWCAAPLAMMAAPAAGAVARADSWGKAIEVPGLARLSAGHGGTLVAVSCSSPGNCSAGGNYTDRLGHQQAFVVNEKNGSWGNAIEVPGLAALNNGTLAGVNSVSCASAGNCAVTGTYDSGAPEAFVVSESNGSWGTAIEVPGGFEPATFASVSCVSAGNCAAAGFSGSITNDASFGPLVVSEKNGTWGSATLVTGTTANAAGSVSCASAGNCEAGGNYAPVIETPYQAFLVREKNGSWGTAFGVPGVAALNVDGNADVASVSCKTARNCAAGGTYRDGSGDQQAFVVSENNGTWSKAIEVPGSAALDTGGSAQIASVSCTSARYCVAAGNYTDSSGNGGAFLVSRT
jgi:hypothetical protein